MTSPAGLKCFLFLTIAATWLLAGVGCASTPTNALKPTPTPTKHPAAGTNIARWHTIQIEPRKHLPDIHFHDKINPVWWLQNADEPVPPAWYRPDDKHRITKWHFRNPLHNFNYYIIGVADKKIVRCGRYPDRISNPNGGWNFAVARRKLVFLPFICYERRWVTFYLGWREHGAFGSALRFHRKPAVANISTNASH